MRDAFRRWLDQQDYTNKTKSTQWTDASRLERHYGDLDAAYDADRFAAILAELIYSKDDERASRPNPSRLEIDGNLYTNLATFRATLKYYARFRESEAGGVAPAHSSKLDLAALERLKRAFLTRYGDFSSLGFQADRGTYWSDEREYKEEVLAGARAILAHPEQTRAC